MIVIELQFRDRNIDSKICKIAGSELTAPTVLLDRMGNFFIKCPADLRITAGTCDVPLQYRQCRGEVLNNIEIVESPLDIDQLVERKWHEYE